MHKRCLLLLLLLSLLATSEAQQAITPTPEALPCVMIKNTTAKPVVVKISINKGAPESVTLAAGGGVVFYDLPEGNPALKLHASLAVKGGSASTDAASCTLFVSTATTGDAIAQIVSTAEPAYQEHNEEWLVKHNMTARPVKELRSVEATAEPVK